MVLDTKFHQLREEFSIRSPSDWTLIRPEQILALDDIGEKTLNHLRLHLANEGLTLLDDQTPAYWQENLSAIRGATQIAGSQDAIVTPFTILVDKAEQHPFTFAGIIGDSHQQYRPIIVRTRSEHLGPSHGDYTLDGLQYHCHVERKSQEDAIGTVLGWGDRREQFQRTLAFLAEIPSSMIVIESGFDACLVEMSSRGKKSKEQNQKIFHRQVLAWMDDYRVPWIFCGNRRLAEITTYRWLERQWKHRRAQQKQAVTNSKSFNEAFSEAGL
jgi:hypothetical protein